MSTNAALSAELLGDLLPGRLVVEATADYVREAIGTSEHVGLRGKKGVRKSARYRGLAADSTRLILSPGSLRLRTVLAARYEPAPDPRVLDRHNATVESLEQALTFDAMRQERRPKPAGIAEWSRRSRSRFFEALTQVDAESWRGRGQLAMVTLTLPGDWLTVAPDAATFKRHVRALRHRWAREVGPWQAVWKLEFQRRGAPHMHLLMQVPGQTKAGENVRRWLSRSWAEIIAHPDPEQRRRHLAAGTNIDFGFRGTDPKRIATYFLKHGAKTRDSKEYQHVVPAEWREAGAGRFWGIAGLERVAIPVDVDAETFYKLRRILRHVHRANRAGAALQRRRHVLAGLERSGVVSPAMFEHARRATLQDLSPAGYRRDRVLARGVRGGWVAVNDAPALAHQIARFLAKPAHSVGCVCQECFRQATSPYAIARFLGEI